MKVKYCLDCGIKISRPSKRCKSCAAKWMHKIKILNFGGTKNPNYKKGLPNCIVCGKKLSDYRYKRCYNCDVLRRIKVKEGVFREKIRKKTLPEIQTELILKNLKLNFRYVGDGKEWVGGFNPDFINKRNKLIIEVFGNYWHNRTEAKKKDKGRVAAYLRNGYKLLIIWDYELKNIKKVIKKIIKLTRKE